MNQLGKNLALALCLVVTLLAILGVKRKFGGDDNAALLSQPAESTENSAGSVEGGASTSSIASKASRTARSSNRLADDFSIWRFRYRVYAR